MDHEIQCLIWECFIMLPFMPLKVFNQPHLQDPLKQLRQDRKNKLAYKWRTPWDPSLKMASLKHSG